MTAVPQLEKWLSHVRAALDDGTLVKVTLGGNCGRDPTLRQILVRRIKLRDGERLAFVYRHESLDVTKHFPIKQGLIRLRQFLRVDFRNAHLFTTERVLELERREGKRPRLIESKPVHSAAPSTEHDRRKKRLIEPGSPWLHGLGVTTAAGKVCGGMEAKFRQIGRFIELLQHLLASAPRHGTEVIVPRRPFTLIDMGCGKGYLTFAACDWLRQSGRPELVVRGIEARDELVALCNRVARESGLTQLRFETGTIADARLDDVDVLVALHACDTATDDAIAKGINAGASLVVVSPCCHKELRSRMKPPKVMAGTLKHGIFLERHAEFVTDSLRSALLEWAGYDANVFEFVATEHTAKNLMITATKRASTEDREALAQRVRELAQFYGIRSQRLADQLGFDLTVPGA